MYKLAVTHSISTWRKQCSPQNFPLLFILIVFTIPHWPIMAPQTPKQDTCWSELSWQSGASFHVPSAWTKQQPTYMIVRCDTANVASQIMTQDTHSNKVSNTRNTASKMHNAIQCDEIHDEVDIRQQSIYWTSSIQWELYDEFCSVHEWYPPWSSNALVGIVRNIKQHEVISSAMFAFEFHEQHSWELMKEALNTLEEVMEAYIVEVIAESNF